VIRLVLTVLVILLFLLCVAGMWWGWRNRARRQAAVLPPLPEMPGWWDGGQRPGEPLLPGATGVYVGTTMAGQWQNRVAIGDIGFRSAAKLELFPTGLLIDRTGATPLWIPADAVADARTDRALAGKVMGIDGLLVVRWRLGDHELDSGFRGDDKDSYGEWVRALRDLAVHQDTPGEDGT
jgi:hypothetical protein